MYRMKADGVVFYDPSSNDMSLQVVSPKATFELNKIWKLTFKLLPGNVLYNGLQKMKTIITLEQDDEVIFRGRVLETTSDKYNQKEVYCESELSYLLDSLVRPYEFEGKAADLFRQLVEAHNEQVDEFKRFEVGMITAVDDEDEADTDSQSYANTLSEIRQMLVTRFNGYLRIRVEDGVRYLDYIKEYDEDCGQAVEFGVNMVDIENKIDAGEVFSVLVPLGGYDTKNPNDPVTIKNVNDGKDYIEDEEAIAQYGRIVKSYKWEEVTDPEELLEKALAHMERMKAARTLTIKAVDMHIIDASVDSIRLGKRVRLLSNPHGLDDPEVCVKIDLDIDKPEKSEYTFGIPLESLTDNNASRNRKTSGNIAYLYRQILLKAGYEEVNEIGKRVTSAEVKIDGVAGAVELKASKEEVDAMGERVSSAEMRIDGAESAISMKADKIDLQGYVTMEDFEAVEGWAKHFAGESISANDVVAGRGDFDELWAGQLNGESPSWKGQTVLTGIGTINQSKRYLNIMLADGSTAQLDIVTNVEITPSSSYINYLGKQ